MTRIATFAELEPQKHHADDSREDRLMICLIPANEYALEATVGHVDWQSPRVLRIKEDTIGLEPRMTEALILRVWELLDSKLGEDGASVEWHCPDLAPACRCWFYAGDAEQVIRHLQRFAHPVPPFQQMFDVTMAGAYDEGNSKLR